MKLILEGIPVVSASPISSDRDRGGSAGVAEVDRSWDEKHEGSDPAT